MLLLRSQVLERKSLPARPGDNFYIVSMLNVSKMTVQDQRGLGDDEGSDGGVSVRAV